MNKKAVALLSGGLDSTLAIKLMLEQGVEVLYDDRDTSAGVKFADADLIGIPQRLVLSAKTLEKQAVEMKSRSSDEVKMIAIEGLSGILKELKV